MAQFIYFMVFGMLSLPWRDLIRFEASNAIFGSLNDPLLMSRMTRSGPGGAPRFETKENKWFVTMDITAMSSEVKEKNKVRMDTLYPRV